MQTDELDVIKQSNVTGNTWNIMSALALPSDHIVGVDKGN